MNRSLAASIASNTRWAMEPDRTAATAPARQAFLARFERLVDPDGILPAHERAVRAERLLRAHMKRMSLRAAAARKEKQG